MKYNRFLHRSSFGILSVLAAVVAIAFHPLASDVNESRPLAEQAIWQMQPLVMLPLNPTTTASTPISTSTPASTSGAASALPALW